MKGKFTLLCIAGLTLLSACLCGCNRPDAPGDQTAEPTSTGFTFSTTRQPILDVVGTLNPLSQSTGFVGKTNEAGEPVCQAEIFRVSYDDTLRAPGYFVVEDAAELQTKVLSKSQSEGAAGNPATLFNDTYFTNHAVIAVALPYTSGSVVTTLSAVYIVDGAIDIRLTNDSSGALTADMATFYAVIGLDKSVFDGINNYKVYLNGTPVAVMSSSRVEAQ